MVRSRVPAGPWLQKPGLWISNVNWVGGALGRGRREVLLISSCKGPSAPCPRAWFPHLQSQAFVDWSQSEEFTQFLNVAHAKVGRAQESVPWLVL